MRTLTTELQPWQWDESVWRTHVDRVRAGRTLSPPWPNGARVAVAMSFDADHETVSLRRGITGPGQLSEGEYGARVAVPRILDLLERFSAPASFFVPAVSALLHRNDVRSYVAAGHEVALHGWIHERNTSLARDEEHELTARSLDTLESLTHIRPVGIRTPSWDLSDETLEIVARLGLLYDSSLMADDSCYELLADGRPTGIVELPVEWIRDDAVYFAMDRQGAARPYATPRSVLQLWRDEFDLAYDEGGLFQLTMHPHLIGHRCRIVVLAELLAHITSRPGVWLATHEAVARHARTALAP
jgi:peptidoglycan/xylan/chitin deacetylase (PgdA/CDA1 family)